MKILLSFLLIMLTVGIKAQKKEYIFNGKNLDNWTIIVKDSSISAEDFFYVNDGIIETVGVPAGYARTNKVYENYELHIEWRYPEKPTNSGIMLHVIEPDLIWPGHYQGQLKHGDAGDFIVHGVGMRATLMDTTYSSTETVKPLISKLKLSSEKPAGQWNSFDITCKGNTIMFKVNGVLQNEATNCSITKGCIGLQAEGSKIQYRNLWIKPLK